MINEYWGEGQRDCTDVPSRPASVSAIDRVGLFSERGVFFLSFVTMCRLGFMQRQREIV